MAKNANRPLIVKRVVDDGHHGHHGGAWKVAYADFVTAMMAFFLMLWLLSTSSEDTLKGLAEYFTDASANEGAPGGVGGVLNGITLMPKACALGATSRGMWPKPTRPSTVPSMRRIGTTAGISQRPPCTSLLDNGILRMRASSSAIA